MVLHAANDPIQSVLTLSALMLFHAANDHTTHRLDVVGVLGKSRSQDVRVFAGDVADHHSPGRALLRIRLW